MNPFEESFLNSIVSGAKRAQIIFHVPASVSIAQAITESSWGRSGLSVKANNLFGIKADTSWLGDKVMMPTAEYTHGMRITIDAPFRKYSSHEESIVDHGSFLAKNPRYKPAFSKQDGCSFARAIAQAGYATDPHYAVNLVTLIEQYDLKQYDIKMEQVA